MKKLMNTVFIMFAVASLSSFAMACGKDGHHASHKGSKCPHCKAGKKSCEHKAEKCEACGKAGASCSCKNKASSRVPSSTEEGKPGPSCNHH